MALGGGGDGHERAVDTVTPLDEEGKHEGVGDATTAPLNDLEQLGTEGGSRIMSRKEKRKAAKKMKRKQARKEIAAKVREEEEARLNDPEEQGRVELMERVEEERRELERKEFEERERAWIEAMERRKKLMEEEEEEERRKRELQVENGEEHNQDDDDDWEYVEEGPAEIIWQGNEIIVKKKTVRVPKKGLDVQRLKETNADDSDRPTSNPLPPQSEAFSDYQNSSTASAQQLLENVAQQVPNFGTEQDKAHCPFHLKTGACRFGQRCSRVHFYPDKSSTLLIRNMYTGPGLAWEQDEGLEYTDEEVERSYEEFYEDVHTEFLKFGEIINFKVCRNSSFHLRGNVYVHYKDLESAVLAYNSVNGRFFAGKQVKCEFVNVSRWKVAICGEYMKSRFKTCSRGSACNFIHCFRNPGGDYEWADWDKPPPKYWVSKMAALFGYPPEYSKEEQTDHSGRIRGSRKKISFDSKRHQPRRSASRERDYSSSRRSRKCHDEKNGIHRATSQKEYGGGQMDYDDERTCERKRNPKDRGHSHVRTFNDDDGAVDTDEERWHGDARKHSKRHKVYDSGGENGGLERTTKGPDHDGNKSDIGEDEEARYSHPRRSSKRHKKMKHEASTSKERSHRERNDDDYPRHSNSRSKRRSRSSDDDSRSYHDIHDRWDPEKQSQEDSDSRRNNEGS